MAGSALERGTIFLSYNIKRANISIVPNTIRWYIISLDHITGTRTTVILTSIGPNITVTPTSTDTDTTVILTGIGTITTGTTSKGDTIGPTTHFLSQRAGGEPQVDVVDL